MKIKTYEQEVFLDRLSRLKIEIDGDKEHFRIIYYQDCFEPIIININKKKFIALGNAINEVIKCLWLKEE